MNTKELQQIISASMEIQDELSTLTMPYSSAMIISNNLEKIRKSLEASIDSPLEEVRTDEVIVNRRDECLTLVSKFNISLGRSPIHGSPRRTIEDQAKLFLPLAVTFDKDKYSEIYENIMDMLDKEMMMTPLEGYEIVESLLNISKFFSIK